MTPAPAAPAADQPTRADARHLTDDQIIEVVRSLVRIHLEVERGLRPPQHLTPYLTPAAQRHVDLSPRRVFPQGGPVHPRDIGTPRLTRYPDGRIYATLTAREQHDHWSAIIVQLAPSRDGQLALSELQRVPQRPLARQVQRPAPSDLEGLLKWVEQEHEIVNAAHLAERAAGTLLTPHENRLAEIEHEAADLRKRISHSQQVEATKHTLEAPPQYVTKLLGQPPAHNTWARLQWDSARDAIEQYRQRFDVNDPAALGSLPPTKHQQQARADVVCLVRAAQHSLQGRDHGGASKNRRPSLER